MAGRVRSVRSIWRAITVSGSFVTVTRALFRASGILDRVVARGLVGGDDGADEVRVRGGEILAHVEHAPGIGGGIAVEQHVVVLELGGRHHRVEAGPGIDVAPVEGGAPVGMLKQDELGVLLGQPGALKRADEEDMRVGAAGHRDALDP